MPPQDRLGYGMPNGIVEESLEIVKARNFHASTTDLQMRGKS
jgi:hypothetical protein